MQVAGWLLTPIVAWAVSFLGGWLAAWLAPDEPSLWGGLQWLGGGSLVGAVVGAGIWVLLMRRMGGWPDRRMEGDSARRAAGPPDGETD